MRRDHRADLYVLINGDATEGHHHQTTQVISGGEEAQAYAVEQTFLEVKKRKPKAVFVVRGTECHVGQSEEALGRYLGSEKDVETGNWSRWHWRIDLNDLLIDAQHHGRVGTRPWTQRNATLALAGQIWIEHTKRGLPAPHLAIRSHRHVWADSHDAWPTRVIQTPSFQLKTAYAHKVAADNIADVGGIIVVINPAGRYSVVPALYTPELPRVWDGHDG